MYKGERKPRGKTDKCTERGEFMHAQPLLDDIKKHQQLDRPTQFEVLSNDPTKNANWRIRTTPDGRTDVG